MTAAPGPQQPDEERREPDAWVDGQPVYYPPGFADAWSKLAAGVAAGKTAAELRPEWAAVDRTIDRQRQVDALNAGYDGPDCEIRPAAPSAQPDKFDPRCAYQRAGWNCKRHGPAQPVRGTGEGRR